MIVVGGTGTIGSEFIKRMSGKEEITVVSRDGTKQIRTYADLGHPDGVQFYIRDVSDPNWHDGIETEGEAIVNLAALKHVPACEKNPMQAIENNVETAKNCVDVGEKHVFVSSDKSVNPNNVYGMTKHIAEKVVMDRGGRVIRLGNIRKSRGSVIPLSKRRAKSDGVVYLTHTEMKRWFISREHAAEAIGRVLKSGHDGEIHIPQAMSEEQIEPKLEKIADEYDADMEIIGKREGEKLREQLSWESEEVNWV